MTRVAINGRMAAVRREYLKPDADVQNWPVYDSREHDIFAAGCPICNSSELDEEGLRKKEIFANPEYTQDYSDPLLAFLLAHEAGHRICEPKGGGEFCASLEAVKMFKDRELGEKMAEVWYHRWQFWETTIETHGYAQEFERIPTVQRFLELPWEEKKRARRA